MKMIVGEWKKIFSHKALVVLIIMMMCVPLLYSSVFLSSSWDPYGKTDRIPVAVVNSDAGAEMGGQQLEIGKKFVDDLKNNKSFQWSFDSNKQHALDQLDQGNYFLVIEIPQNFSANATTLMSEQPQKMQLNYYTNPGRNYPVSQIAASAMTKIDEQIADAVRKQYAQTVFESLKTMADGMDKASDGSRKLDEGARALAAGSQTLNANMQKLASGLLVFNNGVQGVGEGAAKLQDGLAASSDGAAKLADGAQNAATGAAGLHQGTVDLDQGLAQLAGAGTQLDAGSAQSAAGAAKLRDGLEQSAQGAGQLQAGVTAYTQGVTKANAALKAVAAAPGTDPALQAQLNAIAASMDQLEAGGAQLQVSSAQLAGAQQQLHDGAATLADGSQELATNMHTVSGKLADAHVGSRKLVDGSAALQTGVDQLAAGSQALTDGLGQLKQGSADLATGVTKLTQASNDLKDGSQKLASGSQSLQQGSSELANGTGSLNSGLSAGAAKSKDVQTVADPTYDMFADPTALAAHKEHDVPQYGAGLTPYILSIGLFSAALMFSSSYALRVPSIHPTSGVAWFLSKLSVVLPVSIVSSLLADLVLVKGLGLQVTSVWRFALFTMVVSLTFQALFIFLAAALGKLGQFMGFILLLLQIGSSEGTFPKVLAPAFFQHLNPLLPMTYAIRGFRQVISLGDYGQLWQQAGILGAYFVGFAVLASLMFSRLKQKHVATPATAPAPAPAPATA